MLAPDEKERTDGGSAGVLLVDPGGLIRSADARAGELFGASARVGEWLRESNIHDFVCEPSEMELAEHLAVAGGGNARPSASEMLLQRPDGETFWARVQSELARDEASSASGGELVRLRFEEIEDPMSDMERLLASEPARVFETPRVQRTRVMLVDHQVGALAEATFLLEALGNEVVGFSDAKPALEEFGLHPNHYDAVLVEAALPPLDGLALCRALLEIRCETPILLATSEARSVDVAGAISLGVDQVLAKPLLEEELAQWLRGVVPAFA